jgi:outer membrane receptor protein involved in Fe transport
MQNVDTGFSRTEQTDPGGLYLTRSLPLGAYTLTISHEGFQTGVRQGITLTVGSEVTVNVELAVGNVQQRVEVMAEAPIVETTNATLSALVSSQQIRELPLNGRSLDSLTLLNPGVFSSKFGTVAPFAGFGLRLSVNGGRPDQNLYLLDGTVANDHSDNGPGSAAQTTLGVEAVLEFRMLTHNFSAEYGRNAGSVVSMVTRSGTNEFHGTAYEFVRNNIFDARDFFTQSSNPPLRRNQFGAAAGGPVKKDRVFFFANYEGLRWRRTQSSIAGVPSVDARRGIIPGQNPITIPAKMIPYINLYPLPNGPSYPDGSGIYAFDYTQPTTEDYLMTRMDFSVSSHDNFYWRYVRDTSNTTQPRPVPLFVDHYETENHHVVLSETHIFSGASVNELRVSMNRTGIRNDSLPTKPIDPSLSFNPGQPFGTIKFSQTGTSGGAGAASAGISEIGSTSNRPTSNPQTIFEENDTFSTVRGGHSLKFGGSIQRYQLNELQTATAGTWTFGGLTSFLTGTPTSLAIQAKPSYFGWRQTLIGYFVQDDWRLSRNLTLNLGLRHEFYTPPTEVNNLASALIHVNDQTRTQGSPFIPSKLNFSPRFGLAWDPRGDGKTSVRLGVGVFYNELNGRQWYGQVGSDPRIFPAYTIRNPIFPNQFALGAPLGSQSTTAIEYNPQTPSVYHFNFEVQRQLLRDLSMRVGYIGTQGVHMARLEQVNTRIPQIQADGTKVFATTAPFMYTNFSSIQYETTDAHYNYNALQVVLQKRFTSGFQFQGTYTWSKAMSDADEIGNAYTNAIVQLTMDPYDLSKDYSLSAYDQRQTLVINSRYDLPFDKRVNNNNRVAKAVLSGWSLNGIYAWGTGLPFAVADGFNNSQNDGTSPADRPNVNPGFSNNPIHGVTAGCGGGIIPAGQKLQTPERWFDPCAFSLSPLGTYGNAGRAIITAPGLSNIDLSLIKNTSLTERFKLEFRAEAFNLFNQAHFGIPALTLFSSSRTYLANAGSIVSTVSPNRQLQLGLKLTF